MYRTTKKKAAADRRWSAIRSGCDRTPGDAGDERVGTYQPPELRRVVIVIDYDIGAPTIDIFSLRRSNRIDSYAASHNGREIAGRIGWANFCKRLSVYFPRLLSPYSQ